MKEETENSVCALTLGRELSAIREQFGIGVAELKPHEIVTLVRACERIANPFQEVNTELAGKPTPVCDGVTMWQPTIGCVMWLENNAARWWKRSGLMFHLAQAYALIHAREQAAFDGMDRLIPAEWRLVKMACRLPVSIGELQEAVARALGSFDQVIYGHTRKDGKQRARAEADFGGLVARLEVLSGIPMKAWLWDKSVAYVAKAYQELHEYADAFSAADKVKSKRMRDELDEATSDLAFVRSMIADRVIQDRQKKGAEQ